MSKSSEIKLPRYNIELTTTQDCNFRCKYCFENDKETPDKNLIQTNLPFVKNQLQKLFNDDWFNNKFESFQIVFWGGEPSLNINIIKSWIGYHNKNIPQLKPHIHNNSDISFCYYLNRFCILCVAITYQI
jgi:sulfatase maturation enzyme AslB (radical SAM superfamily)